MRTNISFRSFVKLLLVVTFLTHVSTAVAPVLDRHYVTFVANSITFHYEGANAGYLSAFECNTNPIAEPNFKIGQKVEIQAARHPLIGDSAPLHAEVELANGYKLLFDHNEFTEKLELKIEQLSPQLPDLKEASRLMKTKLSPQIRPRLNPSISLKQCRMNISEVLLSNDDKAIYTFEMSDLDVPGNYQIYVRNHGNLYTVLMIDKNVNPFPVANGGNGNDGGNGDLLLPGSKVVIGVSISIGFFAVVYYRMTKRRSPTADTAKKEQTGRNSSQSKGEKPGGSLPRKKVHESAHKVPKTKK